MTDAPAPLAAPAPADAAGPQTPRRTRSLKANFLINVAGAVIPLGVSLVTVPIYIRHIGDARYGVLSIVWVLLGYLGFLDFGLSRAAVRSLARRKDAPQEERAQVLVTTMALNLCLGLVGSIVLATLGSYLLQHVLSVPDALKPEIARALPWIVVLFPLALVGGVGIGTLESRERFGMANVLGVGGTAAGQILPVILAVAVGPSLAIVVPAAVVVRATAVLFVLLAVWRQERPLSRHHLSRSKAKELFSYGSWLTVSGVIGPVLVSFDQFVIGSILSVSAVTYYAVPMNLAARTQLLPAALVRTLFPRFAGLNQPEARQLASRAFTTISFAYAVVCAPAIVLSPTCFQYWIGPDFAANAAPVAAILFAGVWVNALAFVPYELIQSQGRADITGKVHVGEILPFVAVLWLLTSNFGIVGAAAAWSLRCVADGLCLFYLARMPSESLKLALMPFGLIIAAGSTSILAGGDLVRSTLCAGVVIPVSICMSIVFASDLRKSVFSSVRALTRRPRNLLFSTASR